MILPPPFEIRGADNASRVRACRAYLTEIRRFVDETRAISGMTSANFFVGRHWERTVPADARGFWTSTEALLRDCMALAGYIGAGASAAGAGVDELPPLELPWPAYWLNLATKARGLALPRLPRPALGKGPELTRRILACTGCSPKKREEICALGAFIAELCAKQSIPCVVDLGSGQGYLSAVLALTYGLRVIGVDKDPVQTEGAERRKQATVQRVPEVADRADNLEYLNRHIDRNEDLDALFAGQRYMICGLRIVLAERERERHRPVRTLNDNIRYVRRPGAEYPAPLLDNARARHCQHWLLLQPYRKVLPGVRGRRLCLPGAHAHGAHAVRAVARAVAANGARRQ